jgi:hypothetical protein
MAIPSTVEFVVDEIGDVTAQRFQGRFVLKTVLSHKEQLRRDELRRLYLGAFNSSSPSPRAANQAELFADINVRITADKAYSGCPNFWKDADMGLDLSDDNVLVAINRELEKGIADRAAAVQEAIKAARGDVKTVIAPQVTQTSNP